MLRSCTAEGSVAAIVADEGRTGRGQQFGVELIFACAIVEEEEVISREVNASAANKSFLGDVGGESVAEGYVFEAEVSHGNEVTALGIEVVATAADIADAACGGSAGVHTRIVVVLADFSGNDAAISAVFNFVVVELVGESAVAGLSHRNDGRTGSPHVAFADTLEEEVEVESFPSATEVE